MMNVAIKKYNCLDMKDLENFGDTEVVKKELDNIYEKSPSGSNFSIKAKKAEENYTLEMKVSSYGNQFYYSGEHQSLREGFIDAVTSIKSQLKRWQSSRLNFYY